MYTLKILFVLKFSHLVNDLTIFFSSNPENTHGRKNYSFKIGFYLTRYDNY